MSTSSLQAFYNNWLKSFFSSKIFGNTKDFKSNHYYLISDGIRLVPSFKKIFDERNEIEEHAWIRIIDIAKRRGEIQSGLSSKQVAKLFMYSSDGLIAAMILQNKTPMLKKEAYLLWDNIYALIKR